MKNILPFLVYAVLISCTKEKETVTDHKIFDSRSLAADSTIIRNIENPDYSGVFEITPQNVSSGKGRAVFVQNGKTLFFFDQNSNKGNIKIDGKDYDLDRFDFNENNYSLYGNGVEIEAVNGDFKSGTGDCVAGDFPEVKVTVNGKTLNLTNINVQDCPNY